MNTDKFSDRAVQKAVDEILATKEWPICHEYDDWGLEAAQYFEFAMAVIRKVKQEK